MAKICYCSEATKELPTLYPVNFNFCPVCGNPFEEVTLTIEETKAKFRYTDTFKIARPLRTRSFQESRTFHRVKLHIIDVATGKALCGVNPKVGWNYRSIPVKKILGRVCKTCESAFDRRFM